MLSLFSSLSLPLFSVCELACSGSFSGRKLVSLAQISAEVVLWGVALSLSYRSNHQFAELPSAQINFFLSSGVALLNYLGTTSIPISFSVGILPLSFLGQWVIEEGRFCFRKLCCLEEQRNASLGRNRAFMSVACSIVLSVLKWWSSYWTLCPGHCVNREGSITLPFNTVSFCRIFSHSSLTCLWCLECHALNLKRHVCFSTGFLVAGCAYTASGSSVVNVYILFSSNINRWKLLYTQYIASYLLLMQKNMWARSIYPPSAWTRTLHYGSEAPAEASQLYKVWIWNAEPSLLAPGSIVASNALLALGKLAVFNSPSVQLGSKLSYIHLIWGHFHIGCSTSIWAQWISYKSHSLHVPADFRKQVTPRRHLALHTEKEAPSANGWRHLVLMLCFEAELAHTLMLALAYLCRKVGKSW